MDYRARLYNTYVSTHFGHIRDLSPEGLEKQARAFRHYYGRLLPQDREARILEVGCGYGAFLYFLQKEGYRHVEGVDISPEQVEAAHKLGLNNVILADAVEYLKGHLQTYDCIVAIDFLEHFSKQEVFDLLEAIYNSLKPGGVFIMQSPNAESIFGSWGYFGDWTHEVIFTRRTVEQVLRACGFLESVKVLPIEPHPHSFASSIRWILWKLIKFVLKFYNLIETGDPGSGIFTRNLIAVGKKPCKGSKGFKR